jgi:hypothetical protein
MRIHDENIQQLLTDGITKIDLQKYIDRSPKVLEKGCEEYTKRLPSIFASSKKKYMNTDFEIYLNKEDIHPISSFERTISATKTQLFSIVKEKDKPEVTISLLVDKEDIRLPYSIISKVIGDAVNDIIFSQIFPTPFIASAERTGSAIFRKELNFARNRLLEQVSKVDKEIDPVEYISKVYSDYALPVKKNVEFTRQLEDISKKESYISTEHPRLLDDFADIIGGMYNVTRNDELYYIPNSCKNVKLTMDESSSAVRSLLDVGFYLRHVARRGDLLMIDEPELNLHPENQRRIARLFSSLVNIGIKVFLTTHSDYIIKEINTLIMLNRDEKYLRKIAEKEGYKPDELISADKIKVFIAEKDLVKLDEHKKRSRCETLVPANIDQTFGIEARSFDTTINEMNRIQDEIIWGDDDE